MIISKVNVYGLENSIVGSKYPMAVDVDSLTDELTNQCVKLAQCEKGTGHDNWLNGVIVQFDLTFTVKAWTEAERYHWLEFISSQSTMHRITKFDLDKSYIEYVDPRMIEIMKELVDVYNVDKTPENFLRVVYSNPCGFRLTAKMTTDYRQLKTIYAQRLNHRLPEWREFCKWIETLPYSYLITGKEEKRDITFDDIYEQFLKFNPDLKDEVIDWRPACKPFLDDSIPNGIVVWLSETVYVTYIYQESED